VRQNGLFEPFVYRSDPFTKTGSGHRESSTQKRTVFCRALESRTKVQVLQPEKPLQVRKRVFLRHFILNVAKTGSGQT
jgi:hypothetical protein